MLKDPLHRLVFRFTSVILAAIILCRVTNGYGIIIVAVIGCFYALRGNAGHSIFIFALLPFLTLLNPFILPKAPFFSMVSRLTTLGVVIALILGGAKRKGDERLPLGYLFIYLVIALVSSFQGYFPLISYFKILNFTAFITGIYVGTKNIDQRSDDIFRVRAGFLAIAIVMVWGSLATLPFPSIAYFTSVRDIIDREGIEAATEVLSDIEGMRLFAGITTHSQFLGPALALLGGWTACDMLFVERHLRILHVAVLSPIPLMIAMTKARVGIITFCALIPILLFYCLPRLKLPKKDRRWISTLLFSFIVIFIAVATIAEIKRGSISRLIRKTSDINEDTRSLFSAFTNSRQEKIAECLHDFKANPLWGKGFQVTEDLVIRYQQGRISIFSASIEKGLLPLMILGETGIVGAAAFLVFLFMFYHDASQKGYTATITLFSGLLVSNMAEATFFSPGGGGGVFWLFTVCGGFLIDMCIKKANLEKPAAIGAAPLNPHRRTRVPLKPST